MRRYSPAVVLNLALLLILANAIACASSSAAADTPTQGPPGPAKINVVTSTNIVADWARQVGGDRVEVFSLVPVGSDPHTFQPGAQDIGRIADAGLVLSIGLSLEAGWMDELLENAARDLSAVVPLGDAVDPLETVEPGDRDEHDEPEGEEDHEAGEEEEDHEADAEEEDHGHGALDPHFWLDPLRVKQAVDVIAAQLSALDPDGQSIYRGNAAAYNRELDALHAWIRGEVAKLPEERRLLVTSHDSLQYFARRYGFQVVGAILPVTTEREPTAQELATLVEDIEEHGAPAVFGDPIESNRLAQRIAEETGAVLIGSLYTGSLGAEGGEAGTYLDLMRYNVETIVEGLR